jgi:hypothetical protein
LYGGTRRTVSCCKGTGFAGLEFDGFFGVPQRVAINKSASYGFWWNQIGNLQLAICDERDEAKAPGA